MRRIVVGEKERVGQWVALRVRRDTAWADYEAIGLERDGELIAGVIFDSYVQDARCCMHVAAVGSEWLNREYLYVCFRYAFVTMNCNVVIGLVNADNPQALKFDRHLGFEEQCRLPGGAGDCDLVVLAMQRKTCRWLNMKRDCHGTLAHN
jgi:RimJ/RimL family protein N-acetyltransferase